MVVFLLLCLQISPELQISTIVEGNLKKKTTN